MRNFMSPSTFESVRTVIAVWIGLEAYTKNMLEKFGMESSKSVNTLVSTGKKADSNPRVNQVNYHCAVGHQLYLSKTWYRML